MTDSQDAVCANNGWGADISYTRPLQRCLCHGQRPSSSKLSYPGGNGRPPLDTTDQDKTHRVWVAFLLYDNDEYERERSLRDYMILPMNWLTVQVTGRKMIHCQLLFWDEPRKQYRTFSVDGRRPVHVYDKKTFADRGWRFFEIMISERQELAIHNFLIAQLGMPLNTAGQLTIFVWPLSGQKRSWFCSELAAAALAEAGVVDFTQWRDRYGTRYTRACEVAPHVLYDYLNRGTVTHSIRLLDGNPVTINTIGQAARKIGRIDIPVDGLPLSITQHVIAGAAQLQEQQQAIASHANLTEQLADDTDDDDGQLIINSMRLTRKK